MQIKGISIYLPPNKLTNKELSEKFGIPEDDIFKKTGVIERRHSSIDFNMEDMAYESVVQLFSQYPEYKNQIDALLLVGHGFSYKAPNTSAVLQGRLELPDHCYCLDLPHGCAGYIYGLSVAKALHDSGIAQNVLLVTSDTPSYVIQNNDVELLSIFGDSATATLILPSTSSFEKFVFKTDGKHFDKLIVERSGTRNRMDKKYFLEENPPDGIMKMDGTSIFLMSIKEVPPLVYQTLEKNNLSIQDIDYFVFHQANSFMLEVLRKKLKIPPEKFFNDIKFTGNTVSSSIPIALHQLLQEKKLQKGMKVLLAGFGIGFMLGATVIEI